jgi:glutathione S-transferase
MSRLHSSQQSFSAAAVELFLTLNDAIKFDRANYDLTPGIWETRASRNLVSVNVLKCVPTWEDESGVVVVESNTLLRFLATKFNKSWYGGDSLNARIAIDSALDFEATSVRAGLRNALDLLCLYSESSERQGVVLELLDFQLFGTESVIFQGLTHGLLRFMEVIDGKLAKSPFVAGDTASIADLPLFVDCIMLEKLFKLNLSRLSAVDAWRKRVESLFEKNRDALDKVCDREVFS